MTIRPSKLSDLPAVQGCAYHAYKLYVPRMGKKPAPMVADLESRIARHDLYVLEAETQVVGFIVFYPRDDHVHIENVAVFPNFQGNGYGTKLIDFAERSAKGLEFSKVELYTNVKMTENITYYTSLGYHEIDRRQEEGFIRVFFCKEL